jgi:hypothetical protein
MITLDLKGISLKLKHEGKTPLVFDPVRKGWYILTPEEHVRQYLLQYFIDVMQYPKGMLAAEKKIMVGNMPKRYDIVVYDRDHMPWMLIECKAPEVEITDKTLQQLLNYQRSIKCRYWVLSNGRQVFCADSNKIENIEWLDALPAYNI